MYKRLHYMALAIVLLVTGLIFHLPEASRSRLNWTLSSVFRPFFEAATAVEDLQEQVQQRFVPREVLESRLNALEREKTRLQFRLKQLDQLRRENRRLREMLRFQERSEWDLLPARIVGRDPANWWRTLKIDVGRADGLEPSLPVVTTGGLVGRVSEVGPNHAQVVLVGDPASRVAARLERTRETGIITPRANVVLDPREVDLKYLPSNPKLEVGDEVVTSGQGGLFPKGLQIGEITDFHEVDYGLYTEARVKLAVDLNRLERVWVLLQ